MHSHHAKCRRPAAAAQYHRNTPPPDDGTPIHAPRHRTCFTQTLSRADPLVVRYTIHTRYATSLISYTKSRHASRRAHHRLPSRDAARGFPAVGARTMRVHVTVRSGRIWAHIGGSDQHDEHQSSHLSESQSVSPPPPSPPCRSPSTVSRGRCGRSPMTHPLGQRQGGRVRRRWRTGLPAWAHHGALFMTTSAFSGWARQQIAVSNEWPVPLSTAELLRA